MEEFRSKKRENKDQHFLSNLDVSDDNTDSDEDDTDSDEGDTNSDEHDTYLDEKDNDSGNELTLWLEEIQREQGREEWWVFLPSSSIVWKICFSQIEIHDSICIEFIEFF